MFISPYEVLKGRDEAYPLTLEMKKNLDILLVSINRMRAMWGKPLIVTSGYRPPEVNAAIGGATNSKHMTCQACDFKDSEAELARFLISRLDVLEACGLWMEDPQSTKGWVHVQIVPPKSGVRVFKP